MYGGRDQRVEFVGDSSRMRNKKGRYGKKLNQLDDLISSILISKQLGRNEANWILKH